MSLIFGRTIVVVSDPSTKSSRISSRIFFDLRGPLVGYFDSHRARLLRVWPPPCLSAGHRAVLVYLRRCVVKPLEPVLLQLSTASETSTEDDYRLCLLFYASPELSEANRSPSPSHSGYICRRTTVHRLTGLRMANPHGRTHPFTVT